MKRRRLSRRKISPWGTQATSSRETQPKAQKEKFLLEKQGRLILTLCILYHLQAILGNLIFSIEANKSFDFKETKMV
jgi:hypothetical protein